MRVQLRVYEAVRAFSFFFIREEEDDRRVREKIFANEEIFFSLLRPLFSLLTSSLF